METPEPQSDLLTVGASAALGYPVSEGSERVWKAPFDHHAEPVDDPRAELTPAVAAQLLSGLPIDWWIAGGWALDPEGTQTHKDVDVAVLRPDHECYATTSRTGISGSPTAERCGLGAAGPSARRRTRCGRARRPATSGTSTSRSSRRGGRLAVPARPLRSATGGRHRGRRRRHPVSQSGARAPLCDARTDAASMSARPVVAHINYHFFQSTQSFIWFYLSRLRRVQPICLTRSPESRRIARKLPAALADDFYLYPGTPRFHVPPSATAAVGHGLRRVLTRLHPRSRRRCSTCFASPSRRAHAVMRTPTTCSSGPRASSSLRGARVLHAYYGPVGWRTLALKQRLGLPLVVTLLGDDLGPTVPAWWSWWYPVRRRAPRLAGATAGAVRRGRPRAR